MWRNRLLCIGVLVSLAIAGLIHPASTLEQPPAQSIEAYFSPDAGIQDRLIKAINLTMSTIDIAIFDFTNGIIAQSLKEAKDRGVKIRIIMDKMKAGSKDSEYTFFKENGFEVKLIKGKGRGIMHNKFILFDGKLLMTGSYNISESAEKYNYENAIFIADKPVIQKYQETFDALWDKGK